MSQTCVWTPPTPPGLDTKSLPLGLKAFSYSADYTTDIAAFNSNSSQKIVSPIVYGGWIASEADGLELQLLAPPTNYAAYSAVSGVEGVMVIVDGRLDLCDEYTTYNMRHDASGKLEGACQESPHLAGASDANLEKVAKSIAVQWCPDNNVLGIQLDLEPISSAYGEKEYVSLINKTATYLRSSELGCKTAAFPNGRSLALFAFAESLTPESGLLEALGPNGLVMISGYVRAEGCGTTTPPPPPPPPHHT